MLDSHYYRHESKVIAVTKEIESTISPDQVTKMYDDVREQVEHDLIASLRVQDNILNGVVMQIADQYDTASSRIHTRFTLNGKEHEDTLTISTRDVQTMPQLYKFLEDHYVQAVQRTIFRQTEPIWTPALVKHR